MVFVNIYIYIFTNIYIYNIYNSAGKVMTVFLKVSQQNYLPSVFYVWYFKT